MKSEARLYHEEESSCLQYVGVLDPEVVQERTPVTGSSIRRFVDVH